MFSSVSSRIPRFAAAASSAAVVGGLAICMTQYSSSKTCSEASAEGYELTSEVAISKTNFTALKVSKNEIVGKNVHKITLDFPSKNSILGMKTAGMLMVQGEKRDGSGTIARPYTPVSRNEMVGKVELVVKDYPTVGNVSSHMCASKVGSTLSVKGCFTKIDVVANKWKKVGLIAGGSGITPMLQVVEELLSKSCDETELTLIFCNQNEESIFLKDHIDNLVSSSKGRFKVHYCVDKVDNNDGAEWKGLTGYVTADMVQKHLPPPDGDNNIIMVCGPPPMYQAICGPKKFEKGKPPAQGEVDGILKDLKYTSNAVFKF